MADNSRIDDLRRRVQRDPASIAFAQLAEEYRRSGQFTESVETCRAGLALHPGYLSAHVTLGRALIELGELDEAQQELDHVLKSAPENLAAIRGLAEIYHRRGDLAQALAQFQAALALAPNDPEIEETVNELSRQVAPRRRQDPPDGISLEQMQSVFELHAPPPQARPAPADVPPSSGPEESVQVAAAQAAAGAPPAAVHTSEAASVDTVVADEPAESPAGSEESRLAEDPGVSPTGDELAEPAADGGSVANAPADEEKRLDVADATEADAVDPAAPPTIVALARLETMSLVLVERAERAASRDAAPDEAMRASRQETDREPAAGESSAEDQADVEGSSGARARSLHQIAALEQWLDAIHVTRAK